MEIKKVPNDSETDSLRIKNKGSESLVEASLTVISYRDKDTRQMVVYIPALDVSGYGETEEKAEEMAKFSIHDYFDWLVNFPDKKT